MAEFVETMVECDDEIVHLVAAAHETELVLGVEQCGRDPTKDHLGAVPTLTLQVNRTDEDVYDPQDVLKRAIDTT